MRTLTSAQFSLALVDMELEKLQLPGWFAEGMSRDWPLPSFLRRLLVRRRGRTRYRSRRRTSGQRLVWYLVSTTSPGKVRVSTRSRFTQLSSAVKNGVPPPTRTG